MSHILLLCHQFDDFAKDVLSDISIETQYHFWLILAELYSLFCALQCYVLIFVESEYYLVAGLDRVFDDYSSLAILQKEAYCVLPIMSFGFHELQSTAFQVLQWCDNNLLKLVDHHIHKLVLLVVGELSKT